MEDIETQVRAKRKIEQAREMMKRIDAEYEAERKEALIKFYIGMGILLIAILSVVYLFITGDNLWM
jgi:hypothetical protein